MSEKEKGEFILMKSVKKKYLNESIEKFRTNNPNYVIFNISAGYGGGSMGGIMCYVIWRRVQ